MDALDKRIVNQLQGGLPITERPYAEAAVRLGTSEDELIERIGRLLADGVLSRFGPMYDVERMGGAYTLCAMRVPEGRYDEVAEAVNAHAEVAHNYEREHRFNMWFVLASEDGERTGEVIAGIEAETGLGVHAMPKIEEFFVGLRFEV